MGSAILFMASQVLIMAAPATSGPSPSGVRVSGIATVQILRAETTRDDGGVTALKRHRRLAAGGRVTIEFE